MFSVIIIKKKTVTKTFFKKFTYVLIAILQLKNTSVYLLTVLYGEQLHESCNNKNIPRDIKVK